MPKGNPNPSPETRFQPGNNANPGGKSKELKQLEAEAALMSAKLRHAALSAMTENVAKGDSALNFLNGDTLRLFKDSEDRAYGTPKAVTEVGGIGGGPMQSAITVRIVGADDADGGTA